ncbi:MAG: 50S ribosomal protein L6 [Candidatus Zixiibacteriota bacterium]|nr:MAG: 50S ribosomal protein L6 [candidate division Zixibacteria bacterium]
MSRIGKKPVPIPEEAKIEIDGQRITVTGPQGSLQRVIHPAISAAVEGQEIIVKRSTDKKKDRALHGLTRALLNNMVVGVTKGFTTELQMIGVGYRAEQKGNCAIFYLGYSHPIVFCPPEGVKVSVDPKEGKIKVEGVDKELVGTAAAKIRSFRKPEPYKGKGVRYVNEYVRSKAGKTAGA